MAIGDKPNQNLFGTNYNAEEEERKKAELAAQGAMMGAGKSTQGSNRQGGFFEPGGFGYEYLGPRLGENIGKFAGEQLYGTGITAEGQATGFPVDRPSLAGDLLTLPGTALNLVGDFATDPLIASGELAQDVVSYATGSSGVQSQQEAAQAPSVDSALEATPSVTPPGETPSVGAQEQVQTIQQGAPDSPQANFATRMSTGEALTPQEVQDAQAFAASMGTTFDPDTGYSREAFENAQPPTPSQFMRYEDSPGQRTEQFVDEQGRMRFRPTQEALQLQGQGAVAQPPVDALSSFEQDSLSRQQRIGSTGSFEGDSEAREARVRANERQPGESQSAADTRAAQSRTTGGQTQGLSFDDAKRRAKAQLAEQGVDDASASMVNDLARGIQAGEPERLEGLETKRAKDAADLEETNTKMGFEPRLIDVGGEKAMELSPGYFQRIAKDKPNKTGLQKTLGNLQDDLKSGRLTQGQYDIAVGNATNIYIGLKEPSTKTGGATGAVSSIVDETIAAGGGEETTPSEFKTGEVREQGGKKFRFDGTNWNEL